MKIHIVIDAGLSEEEIIIRCRALNPKISKIQRAVDQIVGEMQTIPCYQNQAEFFLTAAQILFFQTDAEQVYAHTAEQVYLVKLRLYELEQRLSADFVRVSKSALVNLRHVLSIERNLTSASLIRFHQSHKQLYVSRYYYKILRERMHLALS